MGLKEFRDPAVTRDFAAPRLPIDVAEFHDYAVDWAAEQAEFFVDGELIRTCLRPPAYPMQMMVAVFDFPDRSTGTDADQVPRLVVDHLRHIP
jgi:beta-glucanase (GH16 family)